jgi:hypothetical protein
MFSGVIIMRRQSSMRRYFIRPASIRPAASIAIQTVLDHTLCSGLKEKYFGIVVHRGYHH